MIMMNKKEKEIFKELEDTLKKQNIKISASPSKDYIPVKYNNKNDQTTVFYDKNADNNTILKQVLQAAILTQSFSKEQLNDIYFNYQKTKMNEDVNKPIDQMDVIEYSRHNPLMFVLSRSGNKVIFRYNSDDSIESLKRKISEAKEIMNDPEKQKVVEEAKKHIALNKNLLVKNDKQNVLLVFDKRNIGKDSGFAVYGYGIVGLGTNVKAEVVPAVLSHEIGHLKNSNIYNFFDFISNSLQKKEKEIENVISKLKDKLLSEKLENDLEKIKKKNVEIQEKAKHLSEVLADTNMVESGHYNQSKKLFEDFYRESPSYYNSKSMSYKDFQDYYANVKRRMRFLDQYNDYLKRKDFREKEFKIE